MRDHMGILNHSMDTQSIQYNEMAMIRFIGSNKDEAMNCCGDKKKELLNSECITCVTRPGSVVR
jgi:hypothetical protein